MKKLLAPLLALALALAVPVLPAYGQGAPIGPSNWFTCNKSVSFAGTAALVALVPPATGPLGPGGVLPSIFVCGWILTNTAAVGTFVLTYGTGATCAGSPANFTPTGGLSVGVSAIVLNQQMPTMQTAQGAGLCQNSTATINGIIFYAQF